MGSAESDQSQDDCSFQHHEPVLMQPVVELLQPAAGETIVDCTIGRCGHAIALVNAAQASDSRSSGTAQADDNPARPTTLLGLDLDPANIAFAESLWAERADAAPSPDLRSPHFPVRTIFVHTNFLAIARTLIEHKLRADVVLADLGFASTQIDDPMRGLSFRADAPLDMRLDPTSSTPTAAELLQTMSESELADLIYHIGEEPLARRIARKVAQQRSTRPIQTTLELADLVRSAYGPRARSSRMHPSTRTFMALRIAVNRELEALDGLLDLIEREADTLAAGRPGSWLNPGARIGIISFHSHEDRRVKQAFRQWEKRSSAAILTPRPMVAEGQEVRRNPRSRSAKLRVARISGQSQRQSGT